MCMVLTGALILTLGSNIYPLSYTLLSPNTGCDMLNCKTKKNHQHLLNAHFIIHNCKLHVLQMNDLLSQAAFQGFVCLFVYQQGNILQNIIWEVD